MGGRTVSNEEWRRQHKIKAFRKLKAAVAVTAAPPPSRLVSQFSVFGFRFVDGIRSGIGFAG